MRARCLWVRAQARASQAASRRCGAMQGSLARSCGCATSRVMRAKAAPRPPSTQHAWRAAQVRQACPRELAWLLSGARRKKRRRRRRHPRPAALTAAWRRCAPQDAAHAEVVRKYVDVSVRVGKKLDVYASLTSAGIPRPLGRPGWWLGSPPGPPGVHLRALSIHDPGMLRGTTSRCAPQARSCH